MCVIEDGDRCSVWNETTVKARKRHKCDCCKGFIEPGQTYLKHFSVFEGDATYEKMCGQCEVDRKAFCDAHGGSLWLPSAMRETIRECVGQDAESKAEWGPLLAQLDASRDRYRAQAETKP